MSSPRRNCASTLARRQKLKLERGAARGAKQIALVRCLGSIGIGEAAAPGTRQQKRLRKHWVDGEGAKKRMQRPPAMAPGELGDARGEQDIEEIGNNKKSDHGIEVPILEFAE